MIFNNYLAKLKQIPLEGEDESFAGGRAGEPEEISPTLQVGHFAHATGIRFSRSFS